MVRRPVGAAALFAVLLAACSSTGSDAVPWGARAEAWTDAFTQTEPVVSVPFYDPDVVVSLPGVGYGVQGLLSVAVDVEAEAVRSASSMDSQA